LEARQGKTESSTAEQPSAIYSRCCSPHRLGNGDLGVWLPLDAQAQLSQALLWGRGASQFRFRQGFSIGARTMLPHSVQEPS
jgi:hypothetical protein